MPDKATLFAPPVVKPGTFAEEIGGAGNTFAPAPSPAVAPPQSHASNPVPVTAAPHLAQHAVTAHHTVVASLSPTIGALMMSDAMLDGPVDGTVTAEQGLGAVAANAASVAGSVAGVATTATSTVGSVASSVGSTVGGVTASVGGTVGGVTSAVGGAVGGVAAAAGAH